VQIQAILKGAVALLHKGDPAAALESLMPIYATMESDPKFLRLFADAALRANQGEHAIAPLKQLAQIDIRDHAVHATLGDLLRQSKDFQGAMAHLAQSLKLQPKKPEYLFNLGICLMEVGELKRAEAAFRTALEYRSDYAKAAFGLARSLEAQNDLVGAEKVLISMLVDRSTDTNLWFRLAKNRHERGLRSPALEALTKLQALDISDPAILDQSARILLEFGEARSASEWLNRLGPLFPRDRSLVALATNLRHERGESDYLRGYENEPFDLLPMGMQCDYLTFLSLSGRNERAWELLSEHYEGSLGEEPEEITKARLFLLNELNRFEDVLEVLSRVGLSDSLVATWKLPALIGAGKFGEAAAWVEELPNELLEDQYLIALRDAARHFNQPANFTPPAVHHVMDLSEHMGSSELYELNLLVERQIDALHDFERAPLSQSVVGGTQSPGSLFSTPNRYIDELKQRLLRLIRTELFENQLFSDEPDFDRRRSTNVAMAASWSIKVKASGHHVPHVHSKGWLSCVYYVSVPDAITDHDERNHDGWLALGRPGISSGIETEPLAYIQPKAGRLVVFPSYVWHETLPFEGYGDRMVIAFDLVPSDES
jgi:uncharacterized protein (TIGR02466 family)